MVARSGRIIAGGNWGPQNTLNKNEPVIIGLADLVDDQIDLPLSQWLALRDLLDILLEHLSSTTPQLKPPLPIRILLNDHARSAGLPETISRLLAIEGY